MKCAAVPLPGREPAHDQLAALENPRASPTVSLAVDATEPRSYQAGLPCMSPADIQDVCWLEPRDGPAEMVHAPSQRAVEAPAP